MALQEKALPYTSLGNKDVIQPSPHFIDWGGGLSDGRVGIRTQETGSWDTSFLTTCVLPLTKLGPTVE